MPLSVVTGASAGIGRHIALGLARAGHDVVLVGRSAQKCEAARDWILHAVPGARIELIFADLALLAETRRAGAAILAGGRAIDVLVNNAGVFTPHRQETSEGHERVLAVNHLAPFVLTRAVAPALARGARVVNVGSSSSDNARIDPDDLEGRRRWGRLYSYAQSKLALLMATGLWAEILRPQGVVANTVHPGAVATTLVRAGGAIGLVWRGVAPLLLTEAQGAATPLRAALAPEFADVSGAYIKKQGVVAPNPRALDAELVRRVWAATETLAGPA
jgi:NAD(P)-dependent dehydrogenase (short-subunit alcohol dehydrogenase family)